MKGPLPPSWRTEQEDRRAFDDLCAAIRQGRCTAFVGAGFSAPVVPAWKDLLAGIHAGFPEARRDAVSEVGELLARGSGHALEAAAQMLKDADAGAFHRMLAERLADPLGWPDLDDEVRECTARRVRLLQRIPFRAVLTTNFDGLIDGPVPSRGAYEAVLRPPAYGWWDLLSSNFGEDEGPYQWWSGHEPQTGRDRRGDPEARVRVVKLHGSVDSDAVPPVLTRRDYRERLYEDPGYLTFLKNVISRDAVLYIGFSFTDAYLNELRSELLAMLPERLDPPVAYALMPNVQPTVRSQWRRLEGIHLFTYGSREGQGHAAFDDFLDDLHRATDPVHVFGEKLAGRRILWMDPTPENDAFGVRVLREASEVAAGRPAEIVQVDAPEAALQRLARAQEEGRPFDLVISHYGWQPDGEARSERLLLELRRRDLRVPVIVFTQPEFAEVNKPRILRLGGLAYLWRWNDLFRRIAEAFHEAPEVI